MSIAIGDKVLLRYAPYGSSGVITALSHGKAQVRWVDLELTTKHSPESLVLSVDECEKVTPLMRRLQKRFSKTVPPVANKPPSIHSEPDTEAVRQRRTEIVTRAQKATGVSAEDVAINLAVQAAANPVGDYVGGDPEKARGLVNTAVETLEQIKPEGALQSMLAVQMIGVHNTAIKFLIRATDKDQSFEGTDANVLRATRLMRLFNEQLQALATLRGKTSEQKVTVEHVHVYEGGQAIVGAVGTPRGEGNGN